MPPLSQVIKLFVAIYFLHEIWHDGLPLIQYLSQYSFGPFNSFIQISYCFRANRYRNLHPFAEDSSLSFV